jgi:hypothetical protein
MKDRLTSPLEWQMTAVPVSHPVLPALAERGGTQLQTPRATLLVDTREQTPFNFSRFQGWFAAIEKKALQLGDYSLAGLEDICVMERKDLSDLVHSCTADRIAFVKRLKLMAAYPHRLSVVTSTLSQMKSPYAHTNVDPNRTMQFLVATLAGLRVPFICSETHELGEELVGSYLYQVHLYTGWSPTITPVSVRQRSLELVRRSRWSSGWEGFEATMEFLHSTTVSFDNSHRLGTHASFYTLR